jgi:hypothetical protein
VLTLNGLGTIRLARLHEPKKTADAETERLHCLHFDEEFKMHRLKERQTQRSSKSGVAGLSPAVHAITTSGTRGPLGPTSNDAEDPSPIAVFADVAAAHAEAALGFALSTAPSRR